MRIGQENGLTSAIPARLCVGLGEIIAANPEATCCQLNNAPFSVFMNGWIRRSVEGSQLAGLPKSGSLR